MVIAHLYLFHQIKLKWQISTFCPSLKNACHSVSPQNDVNKIATIFFVPAQMILRCLFSSLRFTKTVNYNIISTAVMKTLPAGCVTFAAPVIGENRIFTFFNITKRFTTERLQLSLLEKNCLYGMRMHILSTWEFHWILQTLAAAYCSRITTQVSKEVKWGYISLISSMLTMINSFLITSFFQWLSVVQFPFILQISLNSRFSFMIALNFFANGDCFLFWIFRLTKSSHHRKEFLRLYNHLKKTIVVLGSYHFLVLSVTLFLHFPQQIVQFIPDHFLGMTLRNKILIGKTTRSRDFSTILKPIMVSAP